MVKIKDIEKYGTSYTYFWEPKHGYLTERDPFHKDKELFIKLIGTEATKGDGVESAAQLRLKNDHYRAKINQLSQQVKSLEVICNRQQRCLKILSGNFDEEETSAEGMNQNNVEVPFSPVSISNIQRQQRPKWQVVKNESYDHAKEIPLSTPCDSHIHKPCQGKFVPPSHALYG